MQFSFKEHTFPLGKIHQFDCKCGNSFFFSRQLYMSDAGMLLVRSAVSWRGFVDSTRDSTGSECPITYFLVAFVEEAGDAVAVSAPRRTYCRLFWLTFRTVYRFIMRYGCISPRLCHA